MEHFIFENLSTYGPIAVFLLLMLSGCGIALGEEMVTLPAGMLIARARMATCDVFPPASVAKPVTLSFSNSIVCDGVRS